MPIPTHLDSTPLELSNTCAMALGKSLIELASQTLLWEAMVLSLTEYPLLAQWYEAQHCIIFALTAIS